MSSCYFCFCLLFTNGSNETAYKLTLTNITKKIELQQTDRKIKMKFQNVDRKKLSWMFCIINIWELCASRSSVNQSLVEANALSIFFYCISCIFYTVSFLQLRAAMDKMCTRKNIAMLQSNNLQMSVETKGVFWFFSSIFILYEMNLCVFFYLLI